MMDFPLEDKKLFVNVWIGKCRFDFYKYTSKNTPNVINTSIEPSLIHMPTKMAYILKALNMSGDESRKFNYWL